METPNVVGYGFRPTDQELIIHYLMNKIQGKSWRVDEVIKEINICDFKPEFLPPLSKIISKDLEWYFFSPIEFLPTKKKVTKRTTASGYWKPTGKDRKIRDRGRKGVEIGSKKTLVYHEGKSANGVRTPWVIHEYHVSSKLLNDQRPYVICKVMYKGDDRDSSNGNNSNELSHSSVSDCINTSPEVEQLDQQDNSHLSLDDLLTPTNQQQQALSSFDGDMVFSNNNDNPYVQPQSSDDDELIRNFLLELNGVEDEIPGQEFTQHTYYNNHMPKKPSTWSIPYYSDTDDSSSDSDAESISATSYQGLSGPGDSDGSSSVDEIPSLSIDSCKDVKTSINRKTQESYITRRTAPSKQEVKEGKSKAVDASIEKKSPSSMVKTEEAMQRNSKNPPYIHFMNMIIDFVNLVGGGCH